MKISSLVAATVSLCILIPVQASAVESRHEQQRIDRGRYLVQTSGCNDCHTPGYGPASGAIPESQWLLGDSVGWHGPWGTTYATNLRLFADRLTEDQWTTVVRTSQPRPPIPWWALREMDEQDVRAIYAFIRSLPVSGDEAPAYLAPEIAPRPPYYTLVVPE